MSDAHPATPRARFNPWPLVPFGVILVACIPSTIMVVLSTQRSTDPVVAAPYQAAERFNDERAAEARWHAAGLSLSAAAIGPQRVRLRLDQRQADGALVPAALTEVVVSRYRSDTSAEDGQWSWSNAQSPELIDLPMGGDWRFTVHGLLDGEAVRQEIWVAAVPWRPASASD